jgi:hypothetical protein
MLVKSKSGKFTFELCDDCECWLGKKVKPFCTCACHEEGEKDE